MTRLTVIFRLAILPHEDRWENLLACDEAILAEEDWSITSILFQNMLYERQVSYCMHYSPQFYENRPIKDAWCTARKTICRTGLKEVENESVKEFWKSFLCDGRDLWRRSEKCRRTIINTELTNVRLGKSVWWVADARPTNTSQEFSTRLHENWWKLNQSAQSFCRGYLL